MKISIITVCYNSANTISDTLHSVRDQSYSDIEHIVIDGGSKDGTLDILTRDGLHVKKIVSERDNGIFDAMNKGIALSTGDIIGFLNSDDVFSGVDVVKEIVYSFRDRSVDSCFGDLVYVSRDDITDIVRYWKSCAYKEGLFQKGWVPAHPTFYARKEVYIKYGNFDSNYRLAADFDILLRFLDVCKISSVYIPLIMIKMRIGGASNSSVRNVFRQNMEIYHSFNKYGYNVGFRPFIFKIISRLMQFFKRPVVL